jgi:hypothetical protein
VQTGVRSSLYIAFHDFSASPARIGPGYKSASHPHGIKVMLADGRVGRVQGIVS